MHPPRKPGRPAKLGLPMTDKQRAALYRARLYESSLVAHEDLKGATTALLLAALARQLKAVSDANQAGTAREIAGQLINELCDRHGIQLSRGYEID